MSTWDNEDGLRQRFGLSRGAVRDDGWQTADKQTLVIELADATTVGATDTAAAEPDGAFVPAGAIIRNAQFIVDTAFTSGGAATLDIGMKKQDGTNIDDNGLNNAITLANLTARNGIESSSTLVNQKMEFDSYVMFTYNTAAFTAGAGRLILEYVT